MMGIRYKKLNNIEELKNMPEIYLVCLNNKPELKIPDAIKSQKLKEICEPTYFKWESEKYPLLYIGISVKLKKRDINQHLRGTSRQSTLRKSLGVLILDKWEFELLNDKKRRFKKEYEAELTTKMDNSIIVFYAYWGDQNKSQLENNERTEINKRNPLLNLQKIDGCNKVNKNFKKELKTLRSKMKSDGFN